MEGKGNQIEQQVKNKIKKFNQHRVGASIPICIFMAFLLLSPVWGKEAFIVRLSMLCTTLLLFCTVAFVLSFRQTSALFLTATIIMTVLLALDQIGTELFLTLTMTNAGAFLISHKIASAFIQSATEEANTINRLKVEATTDYLTQLL
jgi:hypothetical protein